MAPVKETALSSPSKRSAADINLQIELLVKNLNREWGFGLELPNPQASPDRKPSLERACYANIKFLCYRSAIESPYRQFETEANTLYSGWVSKPKAERCVVPERTRQNYRPISAIERTQLLELFIFLTASVKRNMLAEEIKARTPGRRSISTAPIEDRPVLNDEPISINLPVTKPLLRSKRRSNEHENQVQHIKFSKRPKSSEGQAKGSKEQEKDRDPYVKTALPKPTRCEIETFSRVPSESSISPVERKRQISQTNKSSKSANTSFASSRPSSIFDQSAQNDNSHPFTQDTEPEIENSVYVDETDTQSSEEYGSSFDSSALDLELEQFVQADIAETNVESLETRTVTLENEGELLQNDPSSLQERRLRNRLEGVFPDSKDIPDRFFSVPLHVRYEILRVFLYTGIPLSNLKLPLRTQDWTDYNTLWNILRKHEGMADKTFPVKVGKEAWAAANDEFRQGHRGITMTGSLQYTSSSSGPLFKFQLEPLKLELTHRLSRRFGCDRFMEIDIPCMTGQRIPEVMKCLGPRAKTIVIEWLANLPPFMSRYWVRFCTKPKDRKQKYSKQQFQQNVPSESMDRVFYFAIDGMEFQGNKGNKTTPKETETVNFRSAWSVDGLLNWIRPTWENKDQPTHKLYARTALALSRNTATVVIERSKIRSKPDITNSSGEIMTDGAGRMSQALSKKISQMLGLSHLPSGFQGRFGEAKGFWSVDPKDRSPDEWIEVYDSQRKWIRKGGTLDDRDFNDPAHRTFEVNKFSGKLKSADLNEQLMPILMDRAKSKRDMRDALVKLLDSCLRNEVNKERIAMNNPQSFRKWVRDSNTGLTDRVKNGCVLFKAAMPDALDEKMNMLLDAGFEPLKLFYLKELARIAYERKCEDLHQKMNVTIMKSTYAFMVPDWTGSLKEGEVFLNPSEGFSDEGLSLFDGLPLEGHVLVARNPAHFNSDIQRVKAVVTTELLGLRDVIVFSIKGECLASKLSGGDYDGDTAWVCWESSIVDNFENAKVPKCPDLVKKGYIIKDATTYEELVRGKHDPTATFLNYSMEFSLEQKMVGICTIYKEAWCYTYGSIDSREAIWLSKLLSDLVDQAKTGYIFTADHFATFKKDVIKNPQITVPLYKSKDTNAKSKHIIDQLKQTAKDTITAILIDFATSLPKSVPCWDDDLVGLAAWANREAVNDSEWLRIVSKLEADVKGIKQRWAEKMGSRSRMLDEMKPAFGPILADTYERFQAIQPAENTPLTRLLLSSWNGRPELSNWALLKASFLFASYPKQYVSTFVWWMSGIQLCHLKAMKQGITVAVIPQQYAMFKPDATYVRLRSSVNEYQWDAGVMEGEGNEGNDDDDDD